MAGKKVLVVDDEKLIVKPCDIPLLPLTVRN